MPKPYRVHSARLIPADATIITHESKPHVRLTERGKPALYRLTKDGTKYLKPSKRWYFDLRDATGTVRRVKGFADLKATEQLAAEMERKTARARAGLFDPAEDHIRRPLADHLADYANHLEAKGNVAAHNRATVAKIDALLSGCGFVFLPDVDAGKVSAWLAALRRPKPVAAIPNASSFTSKEAGKLLDIGADAVRRFVARHRLPTEGEGKKRRLPRSTVQEIALRLAEGCGPATINHYVRAAKGFFSWLVKSRRLGSSPLDVLALVSTSADVRHARRELSGEDLEELLRGTRKSEAAFRGLSGEDRFMLYLAAAGTGFRASALANLTPADFDLDSATPVVTLAARFAKNRRTKVQPLPANVADALRDYLAGKEPESIIWGGTWATGGVAAEMLRRDLEAVGIPYVVEGTDGPEHADFHCLRHTYLTMLGRNGVDLRTAQELAGHSTPTLTARYSHRRLYDLAGAVDMLPNLVPAEASEAPVELRQVVGSAVVPGVVTGDISLHRTASARTLQVIRAEGADSTQPLETKRAGTSQHQPASSRTKLPGLDSNQDKESQNLLCYRYTTG